MPRLRSALVATAAIAVQTAVTLTVSADARADMVQDLRPGQSFVGDVPPGETIRLTVDVARGAKLRMQFTLQGSSADIWFPANFQRVSVTTEDGTPVAFDQKLWANARYDAKKRRSTFFVTDWAPETGGRYTFAVTHKTTVGTRLSGRVAATRVLRTRFDETSGGSVTVPVQPDDSTHVVVRRRDGGAPFVVSYLFTPGGGLLAPSQKRTKTGSTTQRIYSAAFGDATYTVGAQDNAVPLGRWTGTAVLHTYTRYGRAVLYVENPPGIALTVRNADAFLDVPWALTGAGLSWNGSYLLVTGETGETGGVVRGKYYLSELLDPGPGAFPVALATSADFPPGETVQGHRLLRAGNRHMLAFTSASGGSAALSKFADNLARDGFVPLVDNAASAVNDLFVASDEVTFCVGVPVGPSSHTVYSIDIASMSQAAPPVVIGNDSRPQSAASGAVYRADQNVYELWTPTSVFAATPSDLSHGIFSTAWAALSWEPLRIAESARETFPTSVVVDPQTGVTILHYVEPNTDATGLGTLHRRIFDPLGNEVPGSHATLGSVRRNRPAAVIAGDVLWLAAEGMTNAAVTRYQLLR